MDLHSRYRSVCVLPDHHERLHARQPDRVLCHRDPEYLVFHPCLLDEAQLYLRSPAEEIIRKLP